VGHPLSTIQSPPARFVTNSLLCQLSLQYGHRDEKSILKSQFYGVTPYSSGAKNRRIISNQSPDTTTISGKSSHGATSMPVYLPLSAFCFLTFATSSPASEPRSPRD